MLNKLNLSDRQTGFCWQEEEFLIESRVSDNHLYLASIEKVYLNGRKLISSGGFKSKRTTEGQFRDKDGELHKIELRCYKIVGSWLSFTLLIDDKIVYKGSTPIKGFLTILAIYIPILFLLILFIGRLLGFYLISFNL